MGDMAREAPLIRTRTTLALVATLAMLLLHVLLVAPHGRWQSGVG